MLVSFGEMAEGTIRIMNIATDSAVCVVVFLLGVNLLRKVKIKKLQTENSGKDLFLTAVSFLGASIINLLQILPILNQL